MGSLAGASWESMGVIYLVIILGTLIFMTQARTLNLMLLGDEVSITLGKDLYKSRIWFMLITALIIGFIVFASGMIGFVGLIVPHFTRLFLGTDHKANIPICFLCGALFMVWGRCAVAGNYTEYGVTNRYFNLTGGCTVFVIFAHKKTLQFWG